MFHVEHTIFIRAFQRSMLLARHLIQFFEWDHPDNELVKCIFRSTEIQVFETDLRRPRETRRHSQSLPRPRLNSCQKRL